MTTLVIVAICLLLLGVAGFSIYRAFQNAKFVSRLTKIAVKAGIKAGTKVASAPLSPEELQKAQLEHMRGHGDDYWRRRSGAPPKG